MNKHLRRATLVFGLIVVWVLFLFAVTGAFSQTKVVTDTGTKISQLPLLPLSAPNLTDTTVTVSSLCPGGNCQVSVQALLNALTKMAVNSTPPSTIQILTSNNGLLQLVPAAALIPQLNLPYTWTAAQTFSGGINATGGSLTNVTVNGYLPVNGAAADLGPALGPILGLWPYLYLAPNQVFTGMPTVQNGSLSQMRFVRQNALGDVAGFTFMGAGNGAVGITSSENLPIIFSNNNYTTRLYIDPTFGNFCFNCTNPNTAFDINAQAISIRSTFTPGTSSQACTAGTMGWDTGFLYMCTATNTWKRVAWSTF